MSDGARQSAGRRAEDQIDLADENTRLRAEVDSLKKMLALEQALRKCRNEELARMHRRAGAVIDVEFQ